MSPVAEGILKLPPELHPIEATSFGASEPGRFLFVESGTLDLFVVGEPGDDGESRWRPLLSAGTGTLAPAIPGKSFSLVGRRSPGSRVVEISTAELRAASEGQSEAAGAALDVWLEHILAAMAADELPPREFTPIELGDRLAAAEGDVLRRIGEQIWVQAPGARLRGRAGSRLLKEGELAPLGPNDWLLCERDTTVIARGSAELIAGGELFEALDRVIGNAGRALTAALLREEEAERKRIGERNRLDERLREETAAEFASLMEERRVGAVRPGRDPLLAAVSLVAEHLGTEAQRPPASARIAPRVDELAEIVRASRMFSREVSLRAKRWWKEDAGPIVAFREIPGGDDGADPEVRPVALLRGRFGYELHDPVTGETQRVDAAVSATLREHGHSLYRQLPDRPINGLELVKFGLAGTRRDVVVFALAAIFVAGLSLLLPIASGDVLSHLVPTGQSSLITQVCLGLLGVAVVVALLAAVQNLAALRVEGRLQAQIQAGIWGRIMRLSPAFFRSFSTGDLATRALALAQVQELLGNLGIKMATALVAAIANTILICAYDIRLGLLTVAMLLALGAFGLPLGRRSLALQRTSYDHQREVNSRAFQLIGHVGKLRASAAEERAFAFWADSFARNRDAMFAARRIQNRFAALAASFALGSFAVVFFAAGQWFTVTQDTFFVFTLAYGQALAGALLVAVTAMNSMPIVPLLEGMSPILRAAPEVREALADPGELSGRIEVSGVSFAYDGGAEVLDDVSLSIEPGEFVAIVGPSGSGKSTLMRLLLGFEQPGSGGILFDEQDLSDLDAAAVRRQCGVVMQDSQLFAGDILSNVVGSGVYTADDAWEAIEMVGMDADVAAMPMGMFTVLSEGAGTLSGGQRQRIAIARALVSKPRIIFLDEATSALDNVTQRQVIESMRRLNATRVVVAHRLSTIRDADRIIVMEAGRVAESGTYDELMDLGGTFRRLAERQLA
jgi:NHLM bacteriocin system ABC transporter ATP-binding protein